MRSEREMLELIINTAKEDERIRGVIESLWKLLKDSRREKTRCWLRLFLCAAPCTMRIMHALCMGRAESREGKSSLLDYF